VLGQRAGLRRHIRRCSIFIVSSAIQGSDSELSKSSLVVALPAVYVASQRGADTNLELTTNLDSNASALCREINGGRVRTKF